MERVEKLQALQKIKILADPRRLEILRLLMAGPATLSQLGEALGRSAAWVRHHIQKLETAELIELAETRTTGKITEKYFRAKAGAYVFQEMVLPKSKKPVLIFSGSHDLAVEQAARHLERYAHLLTLPVGSLDGLVNLRQGLCQISGAHLLGADGEYNTGYVNHLFPDREIDLVTFAHRTQGLMVSPGNPLRISALSDLPRQGLRFVNRNSGSGTRLWLDAELKRLGIPAEQIVGYGEVAFTHNATARAVAEGRADAALGLQAAAQKFGLDFIPLFDERYDLVFPREFGEQLEILLNHIQSSGFRQQLSQFGGYQSTSSGAQVALS
jgi:putative molybdopterin biosynthesis protein